MANCLTHGVGLVLAVVGLPVLVVFACLYGNAWHIVSFSIYGATLVLLYGASTLYHGSRRLQQKRILQIIDHSCIFLLIAGTYTPFALVTLQDGWGWSLFGVVWGLSGVGIAMNILLAKRNDLASTLLYLAMGWLALFAIVPLRENLHMGGMFGLFLGGGAYTIGTVFYLWKKIPFNHTLWHLFVLAGSICHYGVVLFFVLS